MNAKPLAAALTLFCFLVSLPALPAVSAYVPPHSGDYFEYHEVESLGNGTGSYAGYTEQTTVNGMERIDSVSGGVASANYEYSWNWKNSTGGTAEGTESGSYTFSSSTFLYLNGTDDQSGYVNPTVWFYMNSTTPKGGTFYLLDTQMSVISKNYSYHLPSANRDVDVIFAQGMSRYTRDDSYGLFNATYDWKAYFDPLTGYIIGYYYAEHDTSPSGVGFTYADDLYITSSSYLASAGSGTIPVVASAGGNGTYLDYALGVVAALVILGVLAYALSRRRKRPRPLPMHSNEQAPTTPPVIDLTPKQPPVQQIVIKEVAMVNCKYCGTLMESTAQVCPRCGAPRT